MISTNERCSKHPLAAKKIDLRVATHNKSEEAQESLSNIFVTQYSDELK